MRFPAETRTLALAALAVHSGSVTLRVVEPLAEQLGLAPETLVGWARAAGMTRTTGKRGRPPGPAAHPYRRDGADSVPRVVGRADLPESAYRLSPQEMDKLDWFLAKHERLTWNEGFTVRLQFD